MFNLPFHGRFDQEGVTSLRHDFSSDLRERAFFEKPRASLKFSRPLLRFLRSAAFAKYTLRKCVYPFHQRSPCTCSALFLLLSKDHFVSMTRGEEASRCSRASIFDSRHVRTREMLHLGSHSPLEFKTDSRQVILPFSITSRPFSPTCHLIFRVVDILFHPTRLFSLLFSCPRPGCNYRFPTIQIFDGCHLNPSSAMHASFSPSVNFGSIYLFQRIRPLG